MLSVVIHDEYRNVGLAVGYSPEALFVIKTDSQVTLTQLWSESVTTRSSRFNYARDMCHGTSMYPTSAKSVFEPGTSQKADGIAKILAGGSLQNFVADHGLTFLSHK